MTKYQLSLLLEKQKLGICTKADEHLLNSWFDDYAEIKALTFVSEEEKENIKSEIRAAIKAGINNTVSIIKRNKVRQFWSIGLAAAIIAGISIAGLYSFLQENTEDKMIVVAAPRSIEHIPVTLPDSSLVVLGGGSSISYPEHFTPGGRNITLTGQAFFSVRPDKKAPFTVSTGKQIAVKVLGTSFVVDISKATEKIEISVITGLVQINEDKKKLDVVNPGEQLLYSCADRTFLKKKYRAAEIAGWQNRSMIYLNSVSLSEIAVLLKTMYHVNLNFDQSKMRYYRFNMSFSKNLSIDHVLSILRSVSSLKFVRDKDEISISE